MSNYDELDAVRQNRTILNFFLRDPETRNPLILVDGPLGNGDGTYSLITMNYYTKVRRKYTFTIEEMIIE